MRKRRKRRRTKKKIQKKHEGGEREGKMEFLCSNGRSINLIIHHLLVLIIALLLPSGGNEVEVLASLRTRHVLGQRESHRRASLGLVENSTIGVGETVVRLLVALIHGGGCCEGDDCDEQAQEEDSLHRGGGESSTSAKTP
ncbi:hypothetical protein PFISCL1PPCAC_27916, partial [Pristionchus fissidentatus]